jgi:ornithine decarboxylase
MTHVPPRDNYTIVSQVSPAIKEFRKELEDDEAFWVADFNRPRDCLELWEQYLPSVKLHYAMKCCDEPNLLRFLADRGVGFDCASKNEIERILSLGVEGSRIVFSHPLKSIAALRYAKEYGIEKVVFDSEAELRKIMKYYPNAECFLRVKPKFSNAKIQLSDKFGATIDDVSHLLSLAHELGTNFIGFSFHVGSQCDDLATMRAALEYVSELKTKAIELGLKVDFIDIGGGFYSPHFPAKSSFNELASGIESIIEELFADEDIEIIGEPGRFIATEYLDLNLPVIGIKQIEHEDGSITQNVYIPDGIYGSFNCIPYDHAQPHFDIFTNSKEIQIVDTNLWGQTCDSMDIIYQQMKWPKLNVGDLLTVHKFGAYTYSSSAFFNGFLHHPVMKMNEEDGNENVH